MQAEPRFKCPFCSFINIHQDTIKHHIRWTRDKNHVDSIHVRSNFSHIVTRQPNSSPYGPYIRKDELKLPWINCLFCDYRDKIEFDLSLHMLEFHREDLLRLPIYRRERKAEKKMSGNFYALFEVPMEYRLDRAVEMAKRKVRD